MTGDPLSVRDPIDVERDDPAGTAALRRALAAYTSDGDHDRFAAAVRERAEGGRARGASRPGGPALSAAVRRAAAVLPPMLLPKGLQELGLAELGWASGGAALFKGGATLGKGAGFASKGGLLGVLALPAITAIMLVVTLYTVLRLLLSLARGGRQDDDSARAQVELARWWRGRRLLTVAVMATLLMLAFWVPGEAITLLLMLSTLALCGLLGRLSALGLASRREVGRRTGWLQLALLQWSVIFISPTRWSSQWGPGANWVLPILAVSGVLCLVLGFGDTRRRLLFAAAWGTVMLSVLLWLVTGAGRREAPLTRDGFAAWIASPPSDVKLGLEWRTLQLCLEHWREAGLPEPDLSGLTARARAAFDEGFKYGAHEQLPVLQLGLLPDDAWRSPRDRHAERQLFSGEGFPYSIQTDLAIRQALREGLLSEADRDVLAARVLATLPSGEFMGAVGELVAAARLLDDLGRPAPAAVFAPRIEALLESTWGLSADGRTGGFAKAPSLLTSAREHAGERFRPSSSWLRANTAALSAMVRWGVPASIDLLAFERWLEEETVLDRWGYRGTSQLQALAALERLRTMPELAAARAALPAPTPLRRAWDWRLPAAALLLGFFALAATLRAPVIELDPDEVRRRWGSPRRRGGQA